MCPHVPVPYNTWQFDGIPACEIIPGLDIPATHV